VATAAKALEAHRRKHDGGNVSGNNRDPELERLSAEFEDRPCAGSPSWNAAA
jgi:hypothetical protein